MKMQIILNDTTEKQNFTTSYTYASITMHTSGLTYHNGIKPRKEMISTNYKVQRRYEQFAVKSVIVKQFSKIRVKNSKR